MTEEKALILPDTQRKMENAFSDANCRSRNEFVKEAIRFYSDHIISQEVTDFLVPELEKFILGFRLGVRLIAECMDDNDGDIRIGGKWLWLRKGQAVRAACANVSMAAGRAATQRAKTR